MLAPQGVFANSVFARARFASLQQSVQRSGQRTSARYIRTSTTSRFIRWEKVSGLSRPRKSVDYPDAVSALGSGVHRTSQEGHLTRPDQFGEPEELLVEVAGKACDRQGVRSSVLLVTLNVGAKAGRVVVGLSLWHTRGTRSVRTGLDWSGLVCLTR